MRRRTDQKSVWYLVCFAFLTLGLALVGCLDVDTTSEADAAQGKKIQTFAIRAGTFELTTDGEPTVNVSDGMTEYTLESDGNVKFTTTAGDERTILLELGEVVIERPAADAVTVITFR
jgi:hypothetical protein